MCALWLLLLLLHAPTYSCGRPCSVSRRGHFVFCRLERWLPRLPRPFPPRTRVRSLRLDIMRASSNLTKDHLRGFAALRVLVVRGRCHEWFQDPTGWRSACSDMRGVLRIHPDAFQHTPHLERLQLLAQPLVVLDNLGPLSNLRVLHLKKAFGLSLIAPLCFLGPHRSLQELSILEHNISYMEPSILRPLKALRKLSLATVNSKVVYRSGAISNLTNLTSLFISCWMNCLVEGVIFERHAITNLPALRTVSIRNLWVVTIQDTPVCSHLGSIERLLYESTSPVLLHNCPELWRCEVCGRQPLKHPQAVLLHKVLMRTPERPRDRRLGRLLPHRALMPYLNVSVLHNTETTFRDLTDELARFPLLRELHMHVPDTKSSFHEGVGTVQLRENPLSFLPQPQHLQQLRLMVWRCNCAVERMLAWAQWHLAPDARLQIACRNIRCVCPAGTRPRHRSDEPDQWIPTQVIANTLAPFCSERKRFRQLVLPPMFCDTDSSCRQRFKATQEPRSRNGATGHRPLLLLMFLLACWR